MVTIKDVARYAQVSIATVSNVVGQTGRVSEPTRQRVLAAISALDYRPNQVARSLKSNRSQHVAIVISDITNPFFPQMVRGADSVLSSSGYMSSIFNTDDSPAREQQIFRLLESRRFDGILLVVALPRAPLPHVQQALQSGTPVVCIDRKPRGLAVDSVIVDNRAAAAAAVTHLIGNGYRDIAYIGGSPDMYIEPDRCAGYKTAMKTAGLKHRIVSGNFRRESGNTAAAHLLDGANPPDALFVANLLMTIGALEAAAARNIGIPEQLGIAAFDAIDLLSAFRPQLTSVVQPSYQLGLEAATLLLDRIEKRTAVEPQTIRLACRLQVGESTAMRT